MRHRLAAAHYDALVDHGLPSGRPHPKNGSREMHTDVSDRGIAASDGDLMGARGDQLADDRVAPGIVRRDGHCLTRLPAVRISRIGDYTGDRRSVPRRIECFFRGRWAPPAVADRGNAARSNSAASESRRAVPRLARNFVSRPSTVATRAPAAKCCWSQTAKHSSARTLLARYTGLTLVSAASNQSARRSWSRRGSSWISTSPADSGTLLCLPWPEVRTSSGLYGKHFDPSLMGKLLLMANWPGE